MGLRERENRLGKWMGWFLGIMALLTLLSRAIYQYGTAQVATERPTGSTISHTVRITGKAVQNQDLAVTTLAGLRVEQVWVSQGQLVEQGQVLFTLERTWLEEQILLQSQELEKQRLSLQDAKNQNALAQKQRANQQARARESYDIAVSQAQTGVNRAEEDLQDAQEALEEFYHREDRQQELLLARESAQAALDQAQARLSQYTGEREQAVADALAQARQEAEEALSPEEEAQIAAQVEERYASLLADAQAAMEQAEAALSETREALDSLRENQSPPEQTLLEAVEQAQEGCDDAQAVLEAAKITYGRDISTANLSGISDNSVAIGEITCAQLEGKLTKLEDLLAQNGEILAPVRGIVTECALRTGEMTTDTTAILLADLTKGCKFSGLATQEDSRYLGAGDVVRLEGTTGKSYGTYPVTTFSTTQEPEGGYRLTVQLPQEALMPGTNLELRFTKTSQTYGCCVPLSALHMDSRNQAYVLVARQVSTVLGTQTQAEKVSVTVLEKNDTTAALEAGALHGEDLVIVSSDRSIDPGSRVRVQ